MSSDATPRQHQVLDFIATSIRERGFSPTLKEIADSMRVQSTNGVNDNLKALERKGLISRGLLQSRSLTITDAGWECLGVRPGCCPHCGAVKEVRVAS